MIRKATKNDIDAIEKIYDKIHTEEEKGNVVIGWVRGIYPIREDAENSLNKNELFVFEDNNEIVASARINKEQAPEYKNAQWDYPAPDDEVMVLHTLVVDPDKKGKGYGTKFVSFYENYAKENRCKFLRMDTNALNKNARALYKKLGYKEVSIVPCDFNGIRGISLVCLEKYLG